MEQPPEDQESAVFNMALDTLKRLGEILKEIKNLPYKITDCSLEVIQSIKINLVKQFFVQASPLLPEDTVTKYKEEVLKLKLVLKQGFTGGKTTARIPVGLKIGYDEDLEKRCDEILIELQLILQKEKYFMPSSEEEGDF